MGFISLLRESSSYAQYCFWAGLFGYSGVHFCKDIIHGSSGWLILNEYFTTAHYTGMVTAASVAMGMGKLSSGLLVDGLRHPKSIFYVSALCCTCSMIILGISTRYGTTGSAIVTPYLFATAYVMIKVLAGYPRVAQLSIIGRYFSMSVFGRLNGIMAASAALANTLSQVTVAMLLGSGWQFSSCAILLGTVGTLFVIPYYWVRSSTPREDIYQDNLELADDGGPSLLISPEPFFQSLSKLATNKIVLALVLESMIIHGVVRINAAFLPLYMIVMLEMTGQQSVYIMAGVSMWYIAATLFAAWVADFTHLRRGLVGIMMITTSIGSLLLMYCWHFSWNMDTGTWVLPFSLLLIQLFCIGGPFCWCDGIFAVEAASGGVQSTCIGVVSASGYAASALVAYLVGSWASSAPGWSRLIQLQLAGHLLLLLVFVLHTYLVFKRDQRIGMGTPVVNGGIPVANIIPLRPRAA